jgi:DNA-directed RNA polymerase specialized sigma24 family protein
VQSRARQLSADDTERLVRQYQAGATVYELAQIFNVTRQTVALRLKEAGVVLRLKSMTSEEIARAVTLYTVGWSLARIGDELDFDPNTVQKELRRAGVAMRKPWERG